MNSKHLFHALHLNCIPTQTVAAMRLVWLLALLTSHADGACNYVKPNEGLWQGSTCDSLWETNNLTCSFLMANHWDCSGCECPGDAPPSSPPPPLPPSDPPGCPNTCLGAGPEYANDGECDDGGPGAAHSICAFGAHCAGSHPSPQPGRTALILRVRALPQLQ